MSLSPPRAAADGTLRRRTLALTAVAIASLLFLAACSPSGPLDGQAAAPPAAAGASGSGGSSATALAVPPLSPAPGSAVPGGATPARAAPDDRALRGTALRGGAPGVVVHLVDGDTLDVALQAGGRERIRLIGIDTPETKKPNHPVECFGPEASARLADLVPEGSAVLLLRDVEARDVYGRFLAYVFRASDGLFVNLDMVESGYARALRIEPNVAFADDVSRAVASARTARRGLWGVCPEVGQGSGRK